MTTPAARAAIKKNKKMKKAIQQREEGGPIGGTSGVQYNPKTHMEMYNADRSMLLIVPISDIISLPETWRPDDSTSVAMRQLQLCPKYDSVHNSNVTHLTQANAEKNAGKFVTSQNNIVTPHGSQGRNQVITDGDLNDHEHSSGGIDGDSSSDDDDDDVNDAPLLDEHVIGTADNRNEQEEEHVDDIHGGS